jgi:prevent-host-death family protein
MDISLADAKAHLSELVEQAANGEEVIITKRGRPVAQLTALQPKRVRIDAKALRAHTDKMTFQTVPAGEFVRAMRDSDRY